MEDTNGHAGRKSAKRVCEGDVIALHVDVLDAKVIANRVNQSVCEIRVKEFKLRNTFTSNVGDTGPVESSAEVFFAGSMEEPELVINAGTAQRFRCRGLSDSERKKLVAAPNEQIADLVSDRTERDRSAVAGQIFASLSEAARKQLLSELAARESEASK